MLVLLKQSIIFFVLVVLWTNVSDLLLEVGICEIWLVGRFSFSGTKLSRNFFVSYIGGNDHGPWLIKFG